MICWLRHSEYQVYDVMFRPISMIKLLIQLIPIYILGLEFI